MQTATSDSLVGRLLEGRYRILDRIARGGMSTVYAAVDERLDRRVAVKVMSSTLSADPAFTDRFSREARAAARLMHVNAVAVYDQGVDDSADGHHVFLVMELVQGRTLRDLIRERVGEHRRFSAAEAVSIMEPVLSALSAAHRAGFVHRDVKPENILLSDDGLVKVADFGLARAVDADATSTHTGAMMGTVAYCAPEQITQGRCDQRSDVYSAGIVLFELLTGRPPYQGDSAMNVAYQHVNSRVPAPSSRVRDVPTPIDEIVVAATDRDPSGRPSDASAFLAEIADARAELQLPIVPIPPRSRRTGAGARPAAYRGAGGGTGRVHRTRAPVGGERTEVIGGHAVHQHTQVVAEDRSGDTMTGAPPPPIVIPPGRRMPQSPRARRRRRRLIALVLVLLLGGLSVAGGLTAAHLYREWNTHVPNVSGDSAAAARSLLRTTGYAVDASVTSRFSETVPQGQVIGTIPRQGHRLAQGKAVRLIISLGKDRVPVPDVSAQTLSAAETSLQERGLRFDPTPRTRTSLTVKQGRVIATDPPAQAQIKRSQVITLIVSSGLPTVTVPTVTPGTPYDQARQALQQAHFSVSRTSDYSDTVPAGGVISITPSGQATYGSTITVDVSNGPPLVTVPDITPLEPYSDLQAQLQQLGLVPNVIRWLGGTNGRVVRIDPGSGTQLPKGSTVRVWVV